MKLLVSVRCGAEVTQALEGGADIIDAKEPARGSLGAVGAEVLGEIADALPAGVPLSVALGDLSSSTEVEGAVAALGVQAARTAYLKVGFAGLAEERRIRHSIGALVASASMLAGRPRVIAVAYADHEQAATLSPSMMAILAAEAGADGVLLDTWTKDGRDLFAWMPLSSLKEWMADRPACWAHRRSGRKYPGRQYSDGAACPTRRRRGAWSGVRGGQNRSGFGVPSPEPESGLRRPPNAGQHFYLELADPAKASVGSVAKRHTRARFPARSCHPTP